MGQHEEVRQLVLGDPCHTLPAIRQQGYVGLAWRVGGRHARCGEAEASPASAVAGRGCQRMCVKSNYKEKKT